MLVTRMRLPGLGASGDFGGGGGDRLLATACPPLLFPVRLQLVLRREALRLEFLVLI